MRSYCSDVLIHIDEELADEAIQQLEREVSFIPGVVSACVNQRARHLMLVDYDPEDVHATDLLGMVRRRGVGAELIGL